MKRIQVKELDHRAINELLSQQKEDCFLENCLGQRYIASGMSNINIKINGIPGNDLGAYLDGAIIEVFGNGQDGVGDTMNDGKIIIHGNCGDGLGYAMRGGQIYVEKNIGYRGGIHMKAYQDKFPVLVIGGCAGSFLGEYQAGGLILVLGLYEEKDLIGSFACTGMHGGKMILRGDYCNLSFGDNVMKRLATNKDKEEFKDYLLEFCQYFDKDFEEIYASTFTILSPYVHNPYQNLYVSN